MKALASDGRIGRSSSRFRAIGSSRRTAPSSRDAGAYAPDLALGEQIEGLIHPREGLLLYTLARRSAHLGNVVEIGAYLGRSTWYLVQGLKARAIAVQGHLHRPARRPEAARRVLRHARVDTALTDWVDPRVGFSHDVAQSFTDAPVGMVWIDGDHSYRTTKEDFEDWFPRLELGGWYAMHDTVNSWLGPTKLARELLVHSSDLTRHRRRLVDALRTEDTARTFSGGRPALKARASFDLLTLMQARRNGFGPQHISAGEQR